MKKTKFSLQKMNTDEVKAARVREEATRIGDNQGKLIPEITWISGAGVERNTSLLIQESIVEEAILITGNVKTSIKTVL